MTAPTTIDSQDLTPAPQFGCAATGPRPSEPQASSRLPRHCGRLQRSVALVREHRAVIITHLDDEVVLVCRSGQRAAQAEETLRAAGLCNVHILDGGITAGKGRGFAVNRGAQRWDLERQVRLVAGPIGWTSTSAASPHPSSSGWPPAFGGGLDLRGAVQYLRHGHAAVEAALQPGSHL